MQVLKLTWGINRCIGLLCFSTVKHVKHVRHVKCDCTRQGDEEETLEPNIRWLLGSLALNMCDSFVREPALSFGPYRDVT